MCLYFLVKETVPKYLLGRFSIWNRLLLLYILLLHRYNFIYYCNLAKKENKSIQKLYCFDGSSFTSRIIVDLDKFALAAIHFFL